MRPARMQGVRDESPEAAGRKHAIAARQMILEIATMLPYRGSRTRSALRNSTNTQISDNIYCCIKIGAGKDRSQNVVSPGPGVPYLTLQRGTICVVPIANLELGGKLSLSAHVVSVYSTKG